MTAAPSHEGRRLPSDVVTLDSRVLVVEFDQPDPDARRQAAQTRVAEGAP